MKTPLIISIIVVVIIAVFLTSRNSQEAPIQQTPTPEASTISNTMPVPGEAGVEVVETTVAPIDGSSEVTVLEQGYELYDPVKLARAVRGDVVLFFRAPWCPTCRALDADIRENLSAIPAGVTILDVDYDSSTDLKQKYGVTYQHTLVQVDAQGNQIAKWTGSLTLAELVAQIQ